MMAERGDVALQDDKRVEEDPLCSPIDDEVGLDFRNENDEDERMGDYLQKS